MIIAYQQTDLEILMEFNDMKSINYITLEIRDSRI